MLSLQKKIPVNQIIEVTITLLLVAVLLLCVLCVMQVSSKGHVDILGHSFFRVATGSMEPTLPVGTLLITRQVEIETLSAKDIVCFYAKDSAMLGRVITHRVMEILEDTNGKIRLLTKGDANLTADGYYVTSENLIGKVVWNSKEGGLISAMMSIFNSQIGFLICVVFPLLLIGSFVLRGSIRSIREGIDEAISELESNTAQEEISQEEYNEIYEDVKQQLLQELANGEIKYEAIPEDTASAGEIPEAEQA